VRKLKNLSEDNSCSREIKSANLEVDSLEYDSAGREVRNANREIIMSVLG
jgi:hypothetical protein